jgi:hypothetical protein
MGEERQGKILEQRLIYLESLPEFNPKTPKPRKIKLSIKIVKNK